jgi:hypothetical protein
LSALTPMFDKRTKLITIEDHNKAAERDERKTRSDKKMQIKVPVTEEEKLLIGRMSLLNGHKGEFHSYLAEVFSEATKRPYISYSKTIPYKNNRNYISTKVPVDVYDKILELKVAWGYRSKLQAAHRILINELMG